MRHEIFSGGGGVPHAFLPTSRGGGPHGCEQPRQLPACGAPQRQPGREFDGGVAVPCTRCVKPPWYAALPRALSPTPPHLYCPDDHSCGRAHNFCALLTPSCPHPISPPPPPISLSQRPAVPPLVLCFFPSQQRAGSDSAAAQVAALTWPPAALHLLCPLARAGEPPHVACILSDAAYGTWSAAASRPCGSPRR